MSSYDLFGSRTYKPKTYKSKTSLFERSVSKRRAFKTSTKKVEWNKAAGRDSLDYKSTSKCRHCKRPLKWGDRSYEFDHKDNNSSNISQKNCYLVCRVCHGKHTVIKKRKKKDMFGQTVGTTTIKKKPGYKKSKKKVVPKKKPKKRTTSGLGIRPPTLKFRF